MSVPLLSRLQEAVVLVTLVVLLLKSDAQETLISFRRRSEVVLLATTLSCFLLLNSHMSTTQHVSRGRSGRASYDARASSSRNERHGCI